MAACRPTRRRRPTCGASSSTRTSIAASRGPSPNRPPRSALPVSSPTERSDMTNGLTSPKAAEGPRAPAPDAARGAPPPSDAFAGILGDAQQARTATAEGQSQEKPTAGDEGAAPQAPAAAPADTPAPDAAATAPAAVLAALAVPVTTPAPAAPVAVAEVAVDPQAVPVIQAEAP